MNSTFGMLRSPDECYSAAMSVISAGFTVSFSTPARDMQASQSTVSYGIRSGANFVGSFPR